MAKRPGFAARFRLAEDGATMLEYVIMIGFLALTCVVAVAAFGQSLKVPLQSAINGLS